MSCGHHRVIECVHCSIVLKQCRCFTGVRKTRVKRGACANCKAQLPPAMTTAGDGDGRE